MFALPALPKTPSFNVQFKFCQAFKLRYFERIRIQQCTMQLLPMLYGSFGCLDKSLTLASLLSVHLITSFFFTKTFFTVFHCFLTIVHNLTKTRFHNSNFQFVWKWKIYCHTLFCFLFHQHCLWSSQRDLPCAAPCCEAVEAYDTMIHERREDVRMTDARELKLCDTETKPRLAMELKLIITSLTRPPPPHIL